MYNVNKKGQKVLHRGKMVQCTRGMMCIRRGKRCSTRGTMLIPVIHYHTACIEFVYCLTSHAKLLKW